MNSYGNAKSGRRAGLYVLIALAFILMILAVVVIVLFPGDDFTKPSTSNINNSSTATKKFSLDVGEAQKLYPLANGLVNVSKDRISFIDMTGAEKFGESVLMEIPVCIVSGDYALVVDTGGTSFTLLNSSGIIYTQGAGSTIDYGFVNAQGYVTLVYDTAGIKGVAKVIDPKGKGLFSWESVESGFILSSYINPDSQIVDVCVYNTDSVSPYPMLKRFSISGDTIAQFSPQIDKMLPIIVYDNNGYPALCGISDIVLYDGAAEKYHKEFYKIFAVESSGKNILAIAKTSVTDSVMLFKIDSAGNVSSGVPLSEEVTGIEVADDIAIIGSGTTVVIVDTKQMKVISRVSLNSTVNRVGITKNGDDVIIVTGDGIYSYHIG